MRLPRAVTGAGTDAASWRLIVRATSRACFAKRPRPPRTARRAEKAVRHAAFVRSYPLTLLPRPRSARRKSPTVIDGCAPESLVRTRLPAGGGSHERTRLWTPGFPASWENTGNFLRRTSILHHIAIKRRVVSSTWWRIPWTCKQGPFWPFTGYALPASAKFLVGSGKLSDG